MGTPKKKYFDLKSTGFNQICPSCHTICEHPPGKGHRKRACPQCEEHMEIILPSIVWEVVPLKNNRFVLECYEVTGQTARTSGRVQVSSKPIETQSAASGRSASAFNMRNKKNEKEQQRALLAYLQGLQGHKDERKKEEAMRKRLRKRLAMKAKLAK